MSIGSQKSFVCTPKPSSTDYLLHLSMANRPRDYPRCVRHLLLADLCDSNVFNQWKKEETRYTDRIWTKDEIAVFEDTILSQKKQGAELRAVHDRLPTRTMPEIVRFYGHWKK